MTKPISFTDHPVTKKRIARRNKQLKRSASHRFRWALCCTELGLPSHKGNYHRRSAFARFIARTFNLK